MGSLARFSITLLLTHRSSLSTSVTLRRLSKLNSSFVSQSGRLHSIAHLNPAGSE